MYFRLGGGTLCGIAKPDAIVWNRVFVQCGKLKIDIDRAKVIALVAADLAADTKASLAAQIGIELSFCDSKADVSTSRGPLFLRRARPAISKEPVVIGAHRPP